MILLAIYSTLLLFIGYKLRDEVLKRQVRKQRTSLLNLGGRMLSTANQLHNNQRN